MRTVLAILTLATLSAAPASAADAKAGKQSMPNRARCATDPMEPGTQLSPR
jgi:hypothetical protein